VRYRPFVRQASPYQMAMLRLVGMSKLRIAIKHALGTL
jgi:hypothetical protein